MIPDLFGLLLPCRYCGTRRPYTYDLREWLSICTIECGVCPHHDEEATPQEVAESWNKRTYE